jgi:hypothetical protein
MAWFFQTRCFTLRWNDPMVKLVVTVATTAALGCGSLSATAADWLQFGYDAAHSGTNPSETALTGANVARLKLLYSAPLPGLVPGAPVLLSGVSTSAGIRDVLYATQSNGALLALDASSGALLWSRYPAPTTACPVPNGNGPCTTATSPVIDPNRKYVYNYGLDGFVHKYTAGDGSEVSGGGWPELATRKPEIEQVSSALTFATARNGTTYLYVVHSGPAWLADDSGDYQGHVTAINLSSGAQVVFNAVCSDMGNVHFVKNDPNPPTTLQPDCPQQQMQAPGDPGPYPTGDAGIWGRAGVVYDAATDRIYISTGNGVYDANNGGHNWSDSVIALPAALDSARTAPLDSYTPDNFLNMMYYDIDLGSTALAIAPPPPGSTRPNIALQGGKDGNVRILDLDNLSGAGGPAHTGGELYIGAVAQGNEVKTQPLVWTDPNGGASMLIIANSFGISAVQIITDSSNGNLPALRTSGAPNWINSGTPVRGSATSTGGTSPVLANNVLYYAGGSGVSAINPRTGATLWSNAAMGAADATTSSSFHKQSLIVVNGRIYVTDNHNTLWAYQGDEVFAGTFE